MKKFICELLVFSICILCIIAILLSCTNRIIEEGNYFTIPSSKKYLAFGHSLPTYAVNDFLIDSLQNFADPAEGYFYTYFKVNQLLKNNSQVQTIFLEYSFDQLNSFANDQRIWGNSVLADKLPKYYPVMSIRSKLKLFLQNPFQTMRVLPICAKKNIEFLADPHMMDYTKSWGGHLESDKIIDLSDEELNARSISNTKEFNGIIQNNYLISETNLFYLAKLVKLCNDLNVDIYFIRTPYYNGVRPSLEPILSQMLKQDFFTVEYLDFIDFPLEHSDWLDDRHTNSSGARKFSLFFNNLLKEGLLKKENKQSFINSKMELKN